MKINKQLPKSTIIAYDYSIHKIIIEELKICEDKADLNHIDVSKVANMKNLFSHSEFNGDISKRNVSNVTDMKGMFCYSKFNGDTYK